MGSDRVQSLLDVGIGVWDRIAFGFGVNTGLDDSDWGQGSLHQNPALIIKALTLNPYSSPYSHPFN